MTQNVYLGKYFEKIRVIFNNKNVTNHHKGYLKWRVMIHYHISGVTEKG